MKRSVTAGVRGSSWVWAVPEVHSLSLIHIFKELATRAEVVFVVGSQSSSNSNRLREVAELLGAKAYLIDNAEQIDPAWLVGVKRIGVTAGASAPEVLVQNVIDRLSGGHADQVSQLTGVEENVTFALPRELQG